MKHYFIDLENTSNAGIHGAKDLGKDSIIYIFHSENAKYLTLDTVSELTMGKAAVLYHKVEVLGPNALDKELVAKMSEVMDKDRSGEYFIISKDKGYKYFTFKIYNQYKRYGATLSQDTSIANATGARNLRILKHFHCISKEKDFDNMLRKVLYPKKVDKYFSSIKAVFLHTNTRQELYECFVKRFGQNLANNLYNAVKNNYDELKEAL